MRDLKNIDRLFQENLKDYEVFPPKKSWDAIEQGLSGTAKRRRIPIWAKISSIAALLVLFFSVGTIYFMPQNNFTKNFTPKKNTQLNTDEKDNSATKTATSSPNTEKSATKLGGKVIQLHSEKKTANLIDSEETIPETVEETAISKKSLNQFSLTDTQNFAFTSLDKKTIEKPLIPQNKFSVATIFAPIYFNSFGSGSGADAQFNNNQTSGKSSYSYGVKLAYKLNNKFTVQSGVNMINLGHQTNDVYITPGVAVIGLSNVSSLPVLAKSDPNSSLKNDVGNETEASLNQVFGYIEIPIEIKYNVTNGKIGVNLVGGFSTLVLNKDEVFVETNAFSQSVGNSNNLRPLNFSGNFGVDVDYSLYKNLFINVSPMLKVQTNTFSQSSGSFQSYYLGVYTGLNYKF